MPSLATLLRKEFSAPSSPTAGLAAYDLEGSVKRTYPETRAALLKPKRMLTSLIPLLSKGDAPGHPFRGNQYTSGQSEVKTARNSAASRYKLAQRLSQQLSDELKEQEKSEKELLAYQMMGSALGDIGTVAHYSTIGNRIVAAISYDVRGDEIHVDFLGSLVKGEGAKLLSRVEALADKENRVVTLMAVSTARAFYESRGYVVTDEKSLEMRREPKSAAKADVDDTGPLAYSKKTVYWRGKKRKVQKWGYEAPETCPCCAQNRAHSVLKTAPKSRVRDYVENAASALKSAIHALLQEWGAKWAEKLAQLLPEAEKVNLAILTKASTKTLEQILDEIEESGFSIAFMDEISPALAKAFKDGGLAARKMVGLENDAREMLELMDEDARDFAKARSAELVGMKWDPDSEEWVKNPDAKWAITETTRQGLRKLVTEGIEQGWSAQDLKERILDSFFFSESRAEMIARTELAFAHVQGNLKGWKDTGVVAGKRAILADTHPFEDVCDENEAQGVVPLDEPFQDGSMGPPFHPNCLCDIVPVLDDEMPDYEKMGKGDKPGHPFRGNQYVGGIPSRPPPEWNRKVVSAITSPAPTIKQILTEEQKKALRDYSEGGHEAINQALRSGKTPKGLAVLDASFSGAKPLSAPLMLYRGAKMSLEDLNSLISSGTFADPAFRSFSRSEAKAIDFREQSLLGATSYKAGSERVVFELLADKGSRVLDLSGISSNPKEQEVLVNRKDRVAVVSARRTGPHTHRVQLLLSPAKKIDSSDLGLLVRGR